VASGSAILEVGRLVACHPGLRVRVAIAPAVALARRLRERMLSPAGEALWKAMTDALRRDLSPASHPD